jgi:PKD domain
VPCQINILTVNGVIPIGGTQPTRLRVRGTAVQCQGVILTTTPNVTAPMTTPATVDPNGRFLIDVPLTGTIACGDQLTVTVICAANTNCTATNSEPLECCSVQIVSVDGIVPQGLLAPTDIRVTGALYGCASDQVTISIPGVTAPRTVTVDPVTGAFNEQLQITATGITCDGPTPIQVIAECANGPATCRDTRRGLLNCPQCFRATLSISAAPCTGTAPNQVQPVTITAQISLPAGQTHDFLIDFGDGTTSAAFQINNSAGTGANVYTHVEPAHNYAPGTYTAELRILTVSECPPVQATLTATCNRCPKATATVTVGDCETSGQLAGSRAVTYTVNFNPQLAGGDTAYANFSYGGTDLATGSTTGTANLTGPGAITHTVYLAPGSYSSTVSLTIVDQQGVTLCLPPLPPLTFSTRAPTAPPAVDVAACLPCPTAVQVTIGTGTPPLPAPHRRFEAIVVWPAPAPPPPPPSPAAYDWTVTLPNGAQAKIVNGPAVVTTQSSPVPWSGAGATASGAVDLSQGGTYGVSVTAKYATGAGLPIDPATGVTSCNLTGPSNFPVTGSPPNCPQINSVSVTAGDCADPNQNKAATIGFAASVQNPAAASGPYQWDFGDPGSPGNVAMTANPVAQHIYATPGTYVVTVSLAATPNCAATSAQGTVTIGRCPCPEGQTRDSAGNCVPTDGDGGGDGDEGFGCTLLRWVGVLLIMLGLFAFIVWLCVPGLPPWASWLILGIAIGLVLAGIVVLLIWAAICPIKPCLWGLLLAWQILLGFGLVCLYLTTCCWWLWIVGGAAIALAAILFGIWIYRCQPTFCQVIIELAPVLTNVLAVIGVVASVAILRACLNPAVGAVVSTISAVLVLILASCATAGTKTKTGAPVN